MMPLCFQRVESCREQERTLRIGKEKTPGGKMRLCLLALLRVLLNITHDNGEQTNRIVFSVSKGMVRHHIIIIISKV